MRGRVRREMYFVDRYKTDDVSFLTKNERDKSLNVSILELPS